MRHLLITLVCATTLLAVAAQAADIYRWKDANGMWHYADQPVPGAERVSAATRGNSTPSAPTADAAARPGAAAASTGASATTKDAARKVQQDLTSVRAEQCKKAQATYQQLIEARRLYKTNAKGEQEFLDEDQIEASRVAARTEMESLCGKAP